MCIREVSRIIICGSIHRYAWHTRVECVIGWVLRGVCGFSVSTMGGAAVGLTFVIFMKIDVRNGVVLISILKEAVKILLLFKYKSFIFILKFKKSIIIIYTGRLYMNIALNVF